MDAGLFTRKHCLAHSLLARRLMDNSPVALITGGARRVGAAIARLLHEKGWRIVVHYGRSHSQAEQLVAELNTRRTASAVSLAGDLAQITSLKTIIDQAAMTWNRLDALINNASNFYPTPIGETTEAQWDHLFTTNLKAPFFLAQAAAPYLKRSGGSIINMVDIYGQRPLKQHPVYSMSKAGIRMLTLSLARELAPDIRVNGIAPGAILWPENQQADDIKYQEAILSRVPLQKMGNPRHIAQAAYFLLAEAPYTTGHVLRVDGGRVLED